jgi:tetratricopeptide (TPR) repeat protein
LAQVFDKTAKTLAAKERAIEHYYAALVHFEDRIDLRTRLAELLLELHHTKDAEAECLKVLIGPLDLKHAEIIARIKRYQDKLQTPKLLATNPDSTKVLRILAHACFENAQSTQQWSPSDQLTVVTSALAVDPNSIELTLLQARIYRERLLDPSLEERTHIANDLVSRLADNHPEVARANLAVYRYRREYQIPDANAALEKALETAPEDYEVLLAAATHAESDAKLDDALSYFRQAISALPSDPRAYAGLAQVQLRKGETVEALEVCRKGLLLCGSDDIAINLVKLQAQIQASQVDAAQVTLDSLKRQQEKFAPLLKLAKRAGLRDEISLLEAEHAIASAKPLQGAAILRQLAITRTGERHETDDWKARAKRLWRLGDVYAQLHYWELAAKAYEEASARQTAKYASLMAAGRAWRSAGRFDAAVASFEAALTAPDAQTDGWVVLARAEIERQLRMTQRDWSKSDSALQRARQELGESPIIGMLSIELQRAKGEQSSALESLAQLVRLHPKDVLPFAILFYEAAGDDDRANECLEQWKGLKGSQRQEILSLEVELCRRRKDYDRAGRLLTGLIVDSKGHDRYNLRRQLAIIEVERGGDGSEAELRALAKDYPNDPWPIERLADLALSRQDFSRLAELDAILEAIEGSNGTLWRFYRAMRLIRQAEDGNDPRFAQATKLHNELQSLRPAWSSTLYLKGRLAQQLGKVEEAAEAYKGAIEAGASSVTVYEGLVTLLYANNRWLEADEFLSRLQEVGYQSALLESFASRLLLRRGEFNDALGAARSGVRLRPEDPLAHIWLGQTLLMASQRQKDDANRQQMTREAEAAFDQAVAVAPEDYRTWSGLLWYGVRARSRLHVARAMEGLRVTAKLSEPQRMLALGQAHQSLGDNARAEESFVRAVHLLPHDAAIHERLAQFYLAYAPEKAEQSLRRVLELSPGSKTARRSLATLLVTMGAEGQFAEAIKLLQDGGDSTDRRLHALLLMQRGGRANLANARSLLESVIQGAASASAADRQLLALVAEADGDLATAKKQLEQLVADTSSPAYIVALIEFLLRHQRQHDAEKYVNRLAQLEPVSPRTVQVRLKWMKAAGRPDSELAKTIDEFATAAITTANDARQRVGIVNRVVRIYTEYGLHERAEGSFRELLRDHPTDDARQAFALWLVNNDRFADAVEFAKREATSGSKMSIQLLTNILAISASHGVRFGDAEGLVEQLVRDHPQDPQLLFEVATLKHMQGEAAVAERLYQQSIRLAPDNAFAHNNLAMLLLSRADAGSESLQHIGEALRIAGPVPELRDTYAVVLACHGQADEACRIMKTLLSRSPRNPRYLLHLAIACKRSGNLSGAVDALTKAQANNVSSEALTPEERKMFDELRRDLAEHGLSES